jgi:hypothetical protein
MLCRSLVVVLVLLAATPALAFAVQDSEERGTQQPAPMPPPTPAPGRTQPPNPPPPTTGKAPAPAPDELLLPAARKLRGKDVNVHVEITISDQSGTAAPDKKVVSLLAADQTMGRVRANARASRANVGFVGTGLNVDARPLVLDGDRILLELTLEYMPLRESPTTQEPTNLNESISVILVSGKTLTISQAADPISDRKMTVEVKATILR